VLVLWIIESYNIESHIEVNIRRVEVYYVFDSVVRNEVEDFFDKLAVRVDHTDPLAVVYILDY
jgi:hypothetical protein